MKADLFKINNYHFDIHHKVPNTKMVDTKNYRVIYYAAGDRYLAQAAVSAASVRRLMPEMIIKLYTDSDYCNDIFDSVIKVEHEGYNYQAKIRAFLAEDELDRFVFLDTDTLVLRPFGHVFDLLDIFDMAAAHEPYRTGSEYGVNPAFGELNTGVVFVRRSEKVQMFVQSWWEEHNKLKLRSRNMNLGDQISFRNTFFASDIKIWVLHPEYNFRTCYPCMAGSGSPVYIIHGPQTFDIDGVVNRSSEFRVFLNSWSQFKQISFGFTSLRSDYIFRKIAHVAGKILR